MSSGCASIPTAALVVLLLVATADAAAVTPQCHAGATSEFSHDETSMLQVNAQMRLNDITMDNESAIAKMAPRSVENLTTEDMNNLEKMVEMADAEGNTSIDYGSKGCQCIGIDFRDGATMVNLTDGLVKYPAGLGSKCTAWDQDTHPDCKADNPPSWCTQPWCFVNPCDCEGIQETPRTSSYLPGGQHKGLPIYYSYETCGGEDTWTTESNYGTACVVQKSQQNCTALSKCSWTLQGECVGKEIASNMAMCASTPDEKVWGNPDCPCVGVSSDLEGKVEASPFDPEWDHDKDDIFAFPPGVGSTCQPWDDGANPECIADPSQEWCHSPWCIVDPCDCRIGDGAETGFFKGATFRGKPVYYSDATCGAIDTFTAKVIAKACPIQKTEEECMAADNNCRWTFLSDAQGMECVGNDVATFCASLSPDKAGAERAATWGIVGLSAWLLATLG